MNDQYPSLDPPSPSMTEPMMVIDFSSTANASSSQSPTVNAGLKLHSKSSLSPDASYTRARGLTVPFSEIIHTSKKRAIDDSNYPDSTGDAVMVVKKRTRTKTTEQKPVEYLAENSDQSPKEPTIAQSQTKPISKANQKLRDAQAGKPNPVGEPPAWGDKRQQICEAIEYFRSYQGGVYRNNHVAYGLLVDGECDPMDFFDEDIIITRVGGGKSLNPNGNREQTKDQKTSGFAEAFKNSKQKQQAIIVIAGQGNKNCPSKLPHRYNVLGWYHATDVWAEKYNEFVRWMVRLERVNPDMKPWFAPISEHLLALTPSNEKHASTPPLSCCKKCGTPSKLQYNAGWTCLNTMCDLYWTFSNNYNDTTLMYTMEFKRERTSFLGKIPDRFSWPLLTENSRNSMGALGYEIACRRGIICLDCGCCIRRRFWDRWECENPLCNFTYSIPQKPVSIHEILERSKETQGMETLSESYRDGVTMEEGICGPYRVYSYSIPDAFGTTIGYVRHFKADAAVNYERDGPNDLFQEIQNGRLELKRNPARLPDNAGEVLTSHWAANWGAPYKFGVKQNSLPFSEAPEVILKTVKRLTWAGKYSVEKVLKEEFQDFNELLSIGYFEDTHIGYHDDGEKELGPTVASLSLGCSATMSFRPKAKSNVGSRKNGKGAGLKQAALKIDLHHGDMMVMHGTKIQKLYEHKVEPRGTLRFALTSRYIRPELLEEEERSDAVEAGKLPEGFHYDYDGELELVTGGRII